MPEGINGNLTRQEFNASLSRPKLDATLVLENDLDDSTEQQKRQQQNTALFALASLNTRTAPSAEVCWSQLLALSLAPESEPVLTVGRHKDCGVRLTDPRASVNHFDIVARKSQKEDSFANSVEGLTYECFLNDRSSNGTTVNGTIVGKGQSRKLCTGDEVCVLPASRVGQDEMIAFLFRNTTETLGTPEGVMALVLDLDELVVCPICMQTIYKCVALNPCSHNFCMACCSDWMRRKNDCPVCRRPITAVMKNLPMDSVVEAFLSANPSRRRSAIELRDMDARDQLRLGASGKLVRDVCSLMQPPSVSPGPASIPTAPASQAPPRVRVGIGNAVADSRASPAPPILEQSRDRGSQVCNLQ